MRIFYSCLFYLLIPFVFIRLWWRSRKAKDYGKRWHERFALQDIPKEWQHGLWVHAVSVGEVMAAVPLVKAVHQQYPDLPVLVTTMTPTGSARVKANFDDSVYHCYIPYDLPSVVRRFLQRAKPRALMLLETELWPNILHQCKQNNIPVMLANARLSQKSFLGYHRFAGVAKQMLDNIAVLAAHAKPDAARFIELGMDPAKVTVTGSIKFELKVSASILEKAEVLRKMLGSQRPIWIAASTHVGEEEQLLAAQQQVLAQIPEALLILTPRHPERFDDVYQLAVKQGFKVQRRSAHEACAPDTQVFIGDTMGELMLFFAAIDVAFLGGSLVEHGGHNLLEPASLGVATIIGPSTFNFSEITKMLVDAGATLSVPDSDALATSVVKLLQSSNERFDMGERGRTVIDQNKGALGAHLALLEDFDLDVELAQ
jgi:3-deoxy-D-manno-octulosonic-acid transferase